MEFIDYRGGPLHIPDALVSSEGGHLAGGWSISSSSILGWFTIPTREASSKAKYILSYTTDLEVSPF